MNGGVDVKVNITGHAGFLRKIANLGNIMEFTEALRKTGENLVNYFGNQVFESQGGAFGTPWKALSPSTIAFKSKHYRQFAAVPLQATGTMRKSFAYRAGALHLEIRNDADYFKYHQSTAPRKKIPRRPMFAINKSVRTIVRHSFEEAFNEKLRTL